MARYAVPCCGCKTEREFLTEQIAAPAPRA
jgi:hypothetical protein